MQTIFVHKCVYFSISISRFWWLCICFIPLCRDRQYYQTWCHPVTHETGLDCATLGAEDEDGLLEGASLTYHQGWFRYTTKIHGSSPPHKVRCAIGQMRMSSHQLHIETDTCTTCKEETVSNKQIGAWDQLASLSSCSIFVFIIHWECL